MVFFFKYFPNILEDSYASSETHMLPLLGMHMCPGQRIGGIDQTDKYIISPLFRSYAMGISIELILHFQQKQNLLSISKSVGTSWHPSQELISYVCGIRKTKNIGSA